MPWSSTWCWCMQDSQGLSPWSHAQCWHWLDWFLTIKVGQWGGWWLRLNELREWSENYQLFLLQSGRWAAKVFAISTCCKEIASTLQMKLLLAAYFCFILCCLGSSRAQARGHTPTQAGFTCLQMYKLSCVDLRREVCFEKTTVVEDMCCRVHLVLFSLSRQNNLVGWIAQQKKDNMRNSRQEHLTEVCKYKHLYYPSDCHYKTVRSWRLLQFLLQ